MVASTEELYAGLVKFLPGTELRAKATKGKLDVYGKSAWAPPPPPVVGPSAEQVAEARELLDEAAERLDELQERVEDGDDDCVTKLLGRLGSLEDALSDARRDTSRASANTALSRALDAQKVVDDRCRSRSAKKWGKELDRVVARLQSATRAL